MGSAEDSVLALTSRQRIFFRFKSSRSRVFFSALKLKMISRFFVIALVATLALKLAESKLTCYKKDGGKKDCDKEKGENACKYTLKEGKKKPTGCAILDELTKKLLKDNCMEGLPGVVPVVPGPVIGRKKRASEKTCYCQKDKCNGQVRQKSSMMVFVGAPVVSVLAKF